MAVTNPTHGVINIDNVTAGGADVALLAAQGTKSRIKILSAVLSRGAAGRIQIHFGAGLTNVRIQSVFGIGSSVFVVLPLDPRVGLGPVNVALNMTSDALGEISGTIYYDVVTQAG